MQAALSNLDYSSEIELDFGIDELGLISTREWKVECYINDYDRTEIRVRAVSEEALCLHIHHICTALAAHPFQQLQLRFYEPARFIQNSEGFEKNYITVIFRIVFEAISRISSLHSLFLHLARPYSYAEEHRRSLSSSLLQHLLLNPSCTLSSLGISNWPASEAETALLASALATNATPPSLKSLHLHFFEATDTQVLETLTALEANTCLTAVSLSSVWQLSLEHELLIYEAAIALLSVNFTLTDLDLHELFIQRSETDVVPKYCRHTVEAVINRIATLQSMLNENASDQAALAVLNTFTRVKPTSARVFFCGNGYAGKTTLQRTMVHMLNASFIRKMWANSFGDSVGKGTQRSRTRGIEVTSVNYCDVDISFWDLAGQKEYHAFHDLMFPNEQGPSLFLIICSLCSEKQATRNTSRPKKPLADVGAELRYWLRYISSNTRKSPNVSFIFTHIDTLGLNEANALFEDQIQNLRKALEQEFDSAIKAVGTTFFVDGRKPNAVHGVLEHTIKEVTEITSNCQSVYDVCNNAKKWITNWMKDHPDQPWMGQNDFINFCIKEFYKPIELSEGVRGQSRKKAADIAEAVLFDLHRTGNLIHFKDEDIVLVDIPWFCKDFMGSILERTFQISMGLSSVDNKLGVWRREDIKKILETACNTEAMCQRRSKSKIGFGKGYASIARQLDGEQLIRFMIQLEICFEVSPGQDIFIPTTLCSSNRQEHRRWSAEKEKPAYNFGYVGRRLECSNKNNTFLTPGFFPRLQVHLRKVFESTLYYLEKDIIKIVDDRMEVLIEFNEAPTSFMDIMVRFLKPKPLDCVLDFISQRVIQNIRDLQRRSGCWQGVELVEVALRPACVKKLIPPQIKQEQSVSLDRLHNIVLNNDLVDGFENSTCVTWHSLEDASLGEEYTPIIELIGQRCFTSILSERLAKVEELSKQLGLSKCVASYSSESDLAIEASFEVQHPRPRPDQMSQMDRVEAKIDDQMSQMDKVAAKIDAIAEDVKVVRGAIDRLLDGVIPEVQRLLTELRNHNVGGLAGQGDNYSKMPRFFLLNKEKSVVYKLVPGLEKLRLNFLCESEPTPHLPMGQEGIEVSILEEGVVRSIQPYLHFFLSTLALIFRMGAPMFQANGIMVPNCSDMLNILLRKSRGLHERSDAFPEAESCSGYDGGGKYVGYDPVALEKARIWVQSFMQEKQCDSPAQISKRLGLMRKELMQGGCAWLCEDHYRRVV